MNFIDFMQQNWVWVTIGFVVVAVIVTSIYRITNTKTGNGIGTVVNDDEEKYIPVNVMLRKEQIVEVEFYDDNVFLLTKDTDILRFRFNNDEELKLFRTKIKDEGVWLEFDCKEADYGK